MASEWSRIDQVPNLEGLDYDQIIHNCWTRRYTGIQELVLDLRLFVETSSSAGPLEHQNQSWTR